MRRVTLTLVIVFSLLIPVITISCDATQPPEAEALIGPDGGVVEVTDTSSPAYGTRLEIAPGALNESVLITVNILEDYELPDSFTPAGLIVELLPSGLNIAGNASTITIPYDPLIVGEDIYSLSIGIYSSVDNTWRFPNIIEIDTSNHTLTGELDHFSVASSIFPPYADFTKSVGCYPSFEFTTDKMVDNYVVPAYCSKCSGGACKGISIYTRWYFTNPDCGHGLWNLYSDEIASKIACYVHREAGIFWRMPGLTPMHIRTARFLWDGLYRTKKPQLMFMTGEYNGKKYEHMVLVYAWDATNMQFRMFDSNHIEEESILPFNGNFPKYDDIFTTYYYVDWKDKYDNICNKAYNNPLYQPEPDLDDARISISPSAINLVGEPHDFTVTVEKNLGAGWVPATGISVTPTHSGVGSITSSGPYLTDSSGQVTVTVNSATPGTATVHASGTVTVNSVSISVATDDYGAYVVDNQKTWEAASLYTRIGIFPPEDVNVVGDPHYLTAIVETSTNGIDWDPYEGATVAFQVISGPGTLDPAITVTDTSGEATTTLSSAESGASLVVASTTVYGFDISTDGTGYNSDPAEKDWVDA